MEKPRVMLCEDELLFATEFQQRLEDLGYEVVGIASDAESAIKLAEQTKPEFALMDIRLRGSMAGTEIAEIIDRRFGIPSLFVTAFCDDQTVNRAAKTSSLGYLVKPVCDKDLELAMKFAHTKSQSLRTFRDKTVAYQSQLEEMVRALNKMKDEERHEGKEESRRVLMPQVAHHINNALSAILGHIGLLEVGGTLPSFEMRQIKYIKDACKRQEDFVKHLLWTSEAGAYKWQFQSLEDVLRKALEKIRAVLPKGVSVEWRLPNKPLIVFMSEDALITSIVEILHNSIRSLDTDGSIIISLDSEAVEDLSEFSENAKQGQFGVITIADNGQGIKPEDLRKVTEPFFTTAAETNVAGLGLSIAYGVSRAHGGGLDIDSEEGKGTTVRIYLPLAEQANTDQLVDSGGRLEQKSLAM